MWQRVYRWTGRLMRERIKEHDRDIRFARDLCGSEHANETGNIPIWSKVKWNTPIAVNQPTCFSARPKSHFYIVFNCTICMLTLMHIYIMWMKILSRICFLDIRTGTFKTICVWFPLNSLQLRSKQGSLCTFWVFNSNESRIMLRCYSRAAFKRINTVIILSSIWQFGEYI